MKDNISLTVSWLQYIYIYIYQCIYMVCSKCIENDGVFIKKEKISDLLFVEASLKIFFWYGAMHQYCICFNILCAMKSYPFF